MLDKKSLLSALRVIVGDDCNMRILSEEADFAGMSEDAIIDIVVSAIYSDEMLDYLNLNMSRFVSSDIQFCVDGGTHNDFWPGEFVYPKRFVCVGHDYVGEYTDCYSSKTNLLCTCIDEDGAVFSMMEYVYHMISKNGVFVDARDNTERSYVDMRCRIVMRSICGFKADYTINDIMDEIKCFPVDYKGLFVRVPMLKNNS